MPFTNMPLRFRVPGRAFRSGESKTVMLGSISLAGRFRPFYFECRDDDDQNDKREPKVLRSQLRPYSDRVHIASVTSHGGTVALRKRYWLLKDHGPDELSGAPGDHPLNNVELAFDGERFNKDIKDTSQCDNQLRATYEAFLGQHLIQLQLLLDVDGDGQTDTTPLFLKIEYAPVP